MAENSEQQVDLFETWLNDNSATITEQYKEGSTFKTYDDGKYILLYQKAQVKASSKDKLGIAFNFIILDAPNSADNNGQRFVWFDLEREDAMRWLAIQAKNSGVVVDPAEVTALLRQTRDDVFGLVGSATVVEAEFVTTTNKETRQSFQNVQIRKHLEGYEISLDGMKADHREQFEKILAELAKEQEENKGSTEGQKPTVNAASGSSSTPVTSAAPVQPTEETVSLNEGMKIVFNRKTSLGDVETEGIVTGMDKEENTVAVSYGNDGKSVVVSVDKIVSIVPEKSVA